MKTTISKSAGSVKLPAKVVETPSSEQTAAEELGEATPTEGESFLSQGSMEMRRVKAHRRKDDDEYIRLRLSAGMYSYFHSSLSFPLHFI